MRRERVTSNEEGELGMKKSRELSRICRDSARLVGLLFIAAFVVCIAPRSSLADCGSCWLDPGCTCPPPNCDNGTFVSSKCVGDVTCTLIPYKRAQETWDCNGTIRTCLDCCCQATGPSSAFSPGLALATARSSCSTLLPRDPWAAILQLLSKPEPARTPDTLPWDAAPPQTLSNVSDTYLRRSQF